MQINFKAPDVYQVQAAPTNKNDVLIKVASIGCVAAMVLGYLGFLGYVTHESNKKD